MTVVAIAGPSGSGKTTLAAGLRDFSNNAVPLVSYATRRRRNSDQPGEMNFVTSAEFQRMARSEEFIWTVKPFKSRFRYGTLRTDVKQALDDEEKVYIALLTVDVIPKLHRFVQEHSKLSRLRCIYLHIDDKVELRRRLLLDPKRTDIKARLASVRGENAAAQKMHDVLHFIDAKLPPEKVLERALHIINVP